MSPAATPPAAQKQFCPPARKVICTECQKAFPSKSQLFKHLETHGVAREGSETAVIEKAAILVGWKTSVSSKLKPSWQVDAVAQAVKEVDELESLKDIRCASLIAPTSGFASSFQSEQNFHGVSDIWSITVRRRVGSNQQRRDALTEWLSAVNHSLQDRGYHDVKVLDKIRIPCKDMDPEKLCSQRVFDCLIPLEMLMPSDDDNGNRVMKDLLSFASEIHETRHGIPQELSKYDAPKVATWEGAKQYPVEDPRERRFYGALKQILKLITEGGRKRWHNFTTGGASPGDTAISRKVDGFSVGRVAIEGRIFARFRLAAEVFLKGQVRHMVGLALAVCRGFLPTKIIEASLSDAIFDIPAVPGWTICLAEVRYAFWETKHRCTLDPRRRHRLDTLDAPANYSEEQDSAMVKEMKAVETTEKLEVAERCLLEWEEAVHKHIGQCYELEEARRGNWLDSFRDLCSSELLKFETVMSLSTRTLEIPTGFSPAPAAYKEVLRLLQEADASGMWPESSEARKRLISDAVEGRQAKLDAKDQALPGGGTFSVGVMGGGLADPKGNSLFPELLRASFLLEKVLVPHRIPSSTIAVNRNAAFLPHRDSGAGAGQTTSLIVALGDFVGGEIVAENVVHDIRYKPLEFDGFAERHWTLPFKGERFSLVWFRCLGVEEDQLFWLKEKSFEGCSL